MANRRKSKSKTPRRKSERKRKRTSKGEYYDDHFEECTTEETDQPGAAAKAKQVEEGKDDVSPSTFPQVVNVDTPAIAVLGAEEEAASVTPSHTLQGKNTASTPSLQGNKTFPVDEIWSGGDMVTPVGRTRRTKSLNLKEELELATSFSSLRNPPLSNSVSAMFPSSVVRA